MTHLYGKVMERLNRQHFVVPEMATGNITWVVSSQTCFLQRWNSKNVKWFQYKLKVTSRT
jgi:hypothetical protein